MHMPRNFEGMEGRSAAGNQGLVGDYNFTPERTYDGSADADLERALRVC